MEGEGRVSRDVRVTSPKVLVGTCTGHTRTESRKLNEKRRKFARRWCAGAPTKK